MKNILFFLISVFVINEFAFCQEVLFSSHFDSNKKQKFFFNTFKNDFESNDLGHWFGIRLGGQAKPKSSKVDNWNFFEQWSAFAMYEYRFDRTISLIAEYHLFNDRSVNFKRNLSAIEVGMKFRFKILNELKLATEGGIAIMRAPAFPFYYGGSIELITNEKISICLNAKTNIIPDFGYWLSAGINYKLFD
jgi:hypothetical protein